MMLETAARKSLLNDATVNGYVAGRVFKHRLLEGLDGTGRRAIVVRRDGNWRRPDSRRTAKYPTLAVECWADHTRDEFGEMVRADGEDSALALAEAVDRAWHGLRGVMWGDLMVASVDRWSEPMMGAPHQRPDGALEAVYFTVRYAVEPVG